MTLLQELHGGKRRSHKPKQVQCSWTKGLALLAALPDGSSCAAGMGQLETVGGVPGASPAQCKVKKNKLWFYSDHLLSSFSFPAKLLCALFCWFLTPLSHFSLGYCLDLPSCLCSRPVLCPSALATGFLVLFVPLLLKCCPKELGPRGGLLDTAGIPT